MTVKVFSQSGRAVGGREAALGWKEPFVRDRWFARKWKSCIAMNSVTDQK